MAEMTRADVYAFLLEHGVTGDIATLYAVALLEYSAAQKNIAKNGSVCGHPRSGVPIDNPYLKVRDRAETKLVALGERVPRAAVAELWECLNTGRAPEPLERGAPEDGAGVDALESEIGSAIEGHL